MDFTAITDIGRKYDHNEDRYILPDHVKKSLIKKKGALFCLCDGMGGVNSGEVAAELSCNWIFKGWYERKGQKKPVEVMKEVIIGTNTRLMDLASEYKQYNGMGCTLVAALFMKNTAFFFNLGDSRAYCFEGEELTQLTEDHSEVWELYKMEAISKDDIRSHPRNNLITRAIGVDKTLKPDDIGVNITDVRKTALYLLCSDGLTDMVSESEITAVLRQEKALEEKGEELVAAANAAGGKDNITVILIQP